MIATQQTQMMLNRILDTLGYSLVCKLARTELAKGVWGLPVRTSALLAQTEAKTLRTATTREHRYPGTQEIKSSPDLSGEGVRRTQVPPTRGS